MWLGASPRARRADRVSLSCSWPPLVLLVACGFVAAGAPAFAGPLLPGMNPPPAAPPAGVPVPDDASPRTAEIAAAVAARHPGATVEVLWSGIEIEPESGETFTVAKVAVDDEVLRVALRHLTGETDLTGDLPQQVAERFIASLPSAYRRMSPALRLSLKGRYGRLPVPMSAAPASVAPGGTGTRGEEPSALPVARGPEADEWRVVLWSRSGADLPELEGLVRPRGRDLLVAGRGPAPHARQEPGEPVTSVTATLRLADLLDLAASPLVREVFPAIEYVRRLDRSVPRVGGDAVQAEGVTGAGISIAIIDSGVDDGHPDLPAAAAESDFTGDTHATPHDDFHVCSGGTRHSRSCTGIAECPAGTRACRPARSGLCADGVTACSVNANCTTAGVPTPCRCPCEVSGHGTHVAGIALGRGAATGSPGMATDADLINAKVLDGGPNSGTNATIINAVNWARGQGADVMNLSLGSHVGPGNPVSDASDPVSRNLDFQAYQHNRIVVVSSDENEAEVVYDDFESGMHWRRVPGANQVTAEPTIAIPDANANRAMRVSFDPAAGTSGGVRRQTVASTAGGQRITGDRLLAISFFARSSVAGGTVEIRVNDAVGEVFAVTRAHTWGQYVAAAPGLGLAAVDHIRSLSFYFTGASARTFFIDHVAIVHRREPGTPDDAYNVISVGVTDLRDTPAGASFVPDWSATGPTTDFRNKPDLVAPGADGPEECHGGRNDGRACAGSGDCRSPGGAFPGCAPVGSGLCDDLATRCTTDADCPGIHRCYCVCGDQIDSLAHDHEGANADASDKAGTSMAAPHVSGLAAQLAGYGTDNAILTDTPYIKAAILNSAEELAGWSRTPLRPLDNRQGAGELHASRALETYSDDDRVWQQKLTGNGIGNAHYYSFTVPAEEAVRLTLVWERHVANPNAPKLLADLDLRMYDAAGSLVSLSISFSDNVEHIRQPGMPAGLYCAEVRASNLGTGGRDGTELYALAGTRPLTFSGTFNPCRPDWGDAPDPFPGYPAGSYPTRPENNGARHLDFTHEWMGNTRPGINGELAKSGAIISHVAVRPSVSGELNPTDPNDQDGTQNLPPGTSDKDGFDDGVIVNVPFFYNGPRVRVYVRVVTTVGRDGAGPGYRYDSSDPHKRIYLNAWCDWNGDKVWSLSEKIIGTGSSTGTAAIDPETFGTDGEFTPGEEFTDLNGNGRHEPWEPFTDVFGRPDTLVSYLVSPPGGPPLEGGMFCRYRLDYGEDAGAVQQTDPSLFEWFGAAQYGEVEDYRTQFLPCGSDQDCFDPFECALTRECDEMTGNCVVTGGPPATCDDGNPCTTGDTCSGTTCIGGPPQPNGTPCSLDACSGPGECDAGACALSGMPTVCDDANPCTNDSCDPALGCQFEPNILPCDDGNPCTLGDVCVVGVCLPGTAINCDDGDPCTDDACTPSGGCSYTFNAAPCDDGDPCSGGDTCSAGLCLGVVPGPDGSACDDADACTTGTTCLAGACQGGTAVACDDGDPCTLDSCNPLVGCFHPPDPIICEDFDICTADFCLPGVGLCHHVELPGACADDCTGLPDGTPCVDGDTCTTGDSCLAGVCAPGPPLVCDDGDPATADSCSAGAGCIHTADADGDGVGDPQDCAPSDASLWGTPVEIWDLQVTGVSPTVVSWASQAPAAGSSTVYDASTGTGFPYSAWGCDSSALATNSLTLTATPPPGGVIFVHVRSRNGCGTGTWGPADLNAATPCPPPCGNLVCELGETCVNCSADCGPCPTVCGDSVCEPGETCSSCPADCGNCPPVCGDLVCNPPAEDCVTCPGDCGSCPGFCGDSVCDGSLEDCVNCPADCGTCPPVCGNAVCESGEDCTNCPADCGPCPPVCGNSVCESGETCSSCPADCGPCPGFCGDSVCDGTLENCANCPADCGSCPPVCGNSVCESGETCSSCPADCGPCPPVCGNSICEAGETCSSCPFDCGPCPGFCGDSVCDGSLENCVNCPVDCGPCLSDSFRPPPPPYGHAELFALRRSAPRLPVP